MFEAIISVADTGRFLIYDKDKRWFVGKDEYILVPEIIHTPELIVVPALATRGRTVLKFHHYACSAPYPDQIRQWSRTWRAAYGAAASRVIGFQDHPAGAHTRMMLMT